MPLPSFLAGLNSQQHEAVTLARQSALIVAGAGSGKTRVLTMRIAYLIQTDQVSPAGILAVTFTNKAAREMLARLSALLPINTRGMWVGTFHGLCNRLLRTHHREASLPALFQILDSQDQLAVVKRLMKTLQIDDDKYPPKQVQHFINHHKEEGQRAAQVEAPDRFTQQMQVIYAAYDTQCHREGVVDFAELLLRSYELLQRNESLRHHYHQRFQHILVDEFQDTNRLQYLWLKLLANPGGTIFAVGDDDQSIYAFRGAQARNMQDFAQEFDVGHVIKLEQNYRSHGNILEAANTLISHNTDRLGKNLWTADGNGERLRVFEAATDRDEATFIVNEVRTLTRDGVRLDDIALLYRANAQSRVLEHALFSAGLSYRVYGGQRFFERKEIKDALAYLRLMANSNDDGAFQRIVNVPPRGIGARTLEQLAAVARQQVISLWSAAQRCPLSGRAGQAVNRFIQGIESLRDSCRDLPLPKQVDNMLMHSELLTHYQKDKQDADRLQNLNELVNAATAFIAEADNHWPDEAKIEAPSSTDSDQTDNASLAAFLAHAALEAGEHQAGSGQDALQLMTVHAAKGLEFNAVFISGLEDGLFPHENSRMEADGLAEERRLLYVAITRARRHLTLSFSQSRMLHGQMRYNVPSRFLEEIPANLVETLSYTADLPRQKAKSAPRYAEMAGQTFRIGQNVHHPKFGDGMIIDCEGGGDDTRVQVKFGNGDSKWLALTYAKLTPT